MGFAAAEVEAGIREVLSAQGLEAAVDDDGARRVFRARDVEIAVGPLPDERRTTTLFHPRCLLVLTGSGPVADALKAAIRVKFLRVTG